MKISGWGRFPVVDVDLINPLCKCDLLDLIEKRNMKDAIPRGFGRSYGDSALASLVIQTKYFDRFKKFDESKGVLTCDAGVSLSDILNFFVPRGWFLPVTPGTKYISVGGAISSDVHGKNHHKEGAFSDHVSSIKILTVSHGVVECSRTQYSELFYATCGGMGLTGLIIEATFSMKRIKSAYVDEVLIKVNNLEELCALLDEKDSYTYSVAWIDCLAKGKSLGRSIMMLGEHSEMGDLSVHGNSRLSIPFDMPNTLLNHYSAKLFNNMYYYKVVRNKSKRTIHYDKFFYPLDKIGNWNRIYGKSGFIQYQFVLPRNSGVDGMREILSRISKSNKGVFLAVLKLFGKGNSNYLSFPMEGYTLALDLKLDCEVMALLRELDTIVSDCSGRLYLAKDSRMEKSMLQSGYQKLDMFVTARKKYGADRIFNSMQSRRLGL